MQHVCYQLGKHSVNETPTTKYKVNTQAWPNQQPASRSYVATTRLGHIVGKASELFWLSKQNCVPQKTQIIDSGRVSNPQGPKSKVRAIPCMGHINVNVKSDPSQTVAGT